MSLPTFNELRIEDIINQVKKDAHFNAYELLKLLNKNNLRIVTAESLTAGLMFSTLVDIPFFGWHKYGGFAVYETDAKIRFLGVNTKDVFTHDCARQMAIGALKKSEASIAIAVTGNASPRQDTGNINKVGEVFIGIAGYVMKNKKKRMIVKTEVINSCLHNQGKSICNLWYDTIIQERTILQQMDKLKNKDLLKSINGFNDFETTSLLSTYIRFKTIEIAFNSAIKFIKTHDLISDTSEPYNIECINDNCKDDTRLGKGNNKIFKAVKRDKLREEKKEKEDKFNVVNCKGSKLSPITMIGVFAGAHYYKWVNPQIDTKKEGYFEYYDEYKNVLGIRRINFDNLIMKWKIINSDKSINIYNCGKTTINIPVSKTKSIPIGSVFGWNHNLGDYGSWVYMVGNKIFVGTPISDFLLEKKLG